MVMPKQHGAWAMLLVPYLIGVIAGNPRWEHLPLLIGWVLLYLSTYPFLMSLTKRKKQSFYRGWFLTYLIIALLFIIYPLSVNFRLLFFGLAMIPFFILNMYFSKQKNERAFLNDLSAIIAFGIGGVGSYYFGTGAIDQTALLIFIVCLLYFIGSTLYIKTMIREKKSLRYKYLSWLYHLILVIIFLSGPFYLLTLAFIPSLVRAIALYGRKMTIKKIGIYEIMNAVYFFVMMGIFFSKF